MVGKEQSPVKTANALVAVHTLLKPYKYFQNPGVDKEAAPPELEAIVKALLEPLLGMLGILGLPSSRHPRHPGLPGIVGIPASRHPRQPGILHASSASRHPRPPNLPASSA